MFYLIALNTESTQNYHFFSLIKIYFKKWSYSPFFDDFAWGPLFLFVISIIPAFLLPSNIILCLLFFLSFIDKISLQN